MIASVYIDHSSARARTMDRAMQSIYASRDVCRKFCQGGGGGGEFIGHYYILTLHFIKCAEGPSTARGIDQISWDFFDFF